MNEKDLQAKLETVQQDARNRLQRDCPALYWEQLIVLDSPRVRLAIDDISYRTKESIEDNIATFQLACKGWLEVYDAKGLTMALEQKLRSLVRVLNPRKTIVIFPGNGAKAVRELLDESIFDKVTCIDLSTQRIVDIRSKIVQGVQITDKTSVRKELAEINPEAILVLDDVITTGSTLRAIQEAFPVRKAEWLAGALMMLSPVQRRSKARSESGIEGYKSVIVPIVYQGLSGIPPLNSLSTFVGGSEKSYVVRENYILDYVDDRMIFMQTVEQLQNKLKGGG